MLVRNRPLVSHSAPILPFVSAEIIPFRVQTIIPGLSFFSQPNFQLSFERDEYGAGLIAQWFRALTAPAEEPGLVPSSHMEAQNHPQLPSHRIQPSPLTSVDTRDIGIYTVHIQACRQNAHAYKILF